MKTLGIAAILLLSALAVSAMNELCAGKPQNSFIAHPTDCQMYILCQNNVAFPERCPQPVNAPEVWFDPNFNNGSCRPAGPFCTPPPCQGRNNVFVPDTASGCGSWHFCVNNEISHSMTCPHGLSFETERQWCTYPACQGASPPVANIPVSPPVHF